MTVEAYQFLRQGLVPEQNASFSREGGTLVVTFWETTELGAQPTQQEVDDAVSDLTVVNGQTFSQWLAEHGGDPVLTKRREARAEHVVGSSPLSVAQRAEMAERNMRDNYLTTRIMELQAVVDAMLASSGQVQALRDAGLAARGAAWSPTATRTRPAARASLKDAINNGAGDT